MPDSQSRRLAAILAADIAGYSALMGADEARTVRDLKAHQSVVLPMIGASSGRIIDTAGDGILAEFPSIVNAVDCAVAIQRTMAERNAAIEPQRRMQFRIGVNFGDVIYDDARIFGEGINIAARLEAVAEPGGICISGKAHDEIRGKVDLTFEDRGEQRFKNIVQPVRVYGVRLDGAPERPPLSLPDKPSIAVVPFQNLSGDPSQDYFADGIAEEITTALARLRGFFVIARNSAFTYKGRAVGVTQIGRELGVRYILEGSVRRAGERVRIGVQLADSDTAREIWVERYERPLADLFALQDEIAASVVTAVEPQLYAAESARLQQMPPSQFDAWDHMIRALSFMWRRTTSDNATALDLLSAALRLDPSYARALGLHALLSLWNAHLCGASTGGLAAVLAGASERARAAVAIDRDDPWARLALGFSHMLRREHEEAVEELRASLDLNPNFALGHSSLGLALAYGNKGAEAVAHLETAMRLSPRDPLFSIFAGARAFAHFMAGEYTAGLDWGRRSVRQSPDVAGHWRALALSAAVLGQREEAQEAVAKARQLQPDYSVAWVERASPLVHAADRARYCDILRPVGLPEK